MTITIFSTLSDFYASWPMVSKIILWVWMIYPTAWVLTKVTTR